MGASAGLMAGIGAALGVIAAPVTGGLSLAAAATAVGAVAGGGVAVARNAAGKPCKSPALSTINTATGVVGGVTGAGLSAAGIPASSAVMGAFL